MRNDKGQFVKGFRVSRSTEFKPGQHWRQKKPHWEEEWLRVRYVDEKRAAADIAVEAECSVHNIYYWLDKHGISRRTTAEARAIKHWGSQGESNPMYGRTGVLNPRYVDGSSPERQKLYARGIGREFLRNILERDGYCCQRCGSIYKGPRSLHVHHIKPWAGNASLRFNSDNVVTLCSPCHRWVHSLKNIAREYLSD